MFTLVLAGIDSGESILHESPGGPETEIVINSVSFWRLVISITLVSEYVTPLIRAPGVTHIWDPVEIFRDEVSV